MAKVAGAMRGRAETARLRSLVIGRALECQDWVLLADLLRALHDLPDKGEVMRLLELRLSMERRIEMWTVLYQTLSEEGLYD